MRNTRMLVINLQIKNEIPPKWDLVVKFAD